MMPPLLPRGSLDPEILPLFSKEPGHLSKTYKLRLLLFSVK